MWVVYHMISHRAGGTSMSISKYYWHRTDYFLNAGRLTKNTRVWGFSRSSPIFQSMNIYRPRINYIFIALS